MNKKVVIVAIIAIVVLMAVWSEFNAPERLVRPVQNATPQLAGAEAIVDEIGHQVICPDSACAANGINIAHSECETATLMRSQIGTMLQNGLTKEGVISHLRMLGFLPGESGLPEGHPPIEAMKDKG